VTHAAMAILTGLTTGLLAVALRQRLTPPGRPVGLRDAILALILMIWVGMGLGAVLAALISADPAAPPLSVAVVATAVGGLSAAAFGWHRLRSAGQQRRFGFAGAARAWWILSVVLVPGFVLVSFAWSALLVALGQDVRPQLLISQISEEPTSLAAVLAIVYGALVAPFIEELVFRGLLLVPIADRAGPGIAVLMTSLLFGLMHLTDPLSVPPLVLFGALLAVLRLRSGSLGPPTLLHVGNNVLAFSLALWAPG